MVSRSVVALLDRAVVDLLAGVVADVGPGLVGPAAPASGRLAGRERDAVEAVDPLARRTRRSSTISRDRVLASASASSKRTWRSATYGGTGSSSIRSRVA